MADVGSLRGDMPNSTVVPFIVRGEGTGVAQKIVAAGTARHTFHADAYPAFGGADAAPSPLFYTLGSLSACNQVTSSLVAKDLGLQLGALTIEVQGDLDVRVLVQGAEGNANFDRVTVRATLETDADEAQFAHLVSEIERRCPVTQMFKRSGLHFDNQWTRAALPLRAAG